MKTTLEELGWRVSEIFRRRPYNTFDLSTMKNDPTFLDDLCRMMEEDGSLAVYRRTSGMRPDRLREWIDAEPERGRRLSAAYEKFDQRYPRCYSARAAEYGGGVALLAALALGMLSVFISSRDISHAIWIGVLVGYFSAQIGAYITRRPRDRPILEAEDEWAR